MLGFGILKGLAVTLKHFAETYIDDLKYFPRRYSEDALAERQSVSGRGIFTIQYPKQDKVVAEQFRYLPFLMYDETDQSPLDAIRCTACGICARVCPPQCIWIVRAKDENGKPMTRPAEYYIDIDLCMNCGLCAEYCPFDAIAMDHDKKLADYERWEAHVFDLERLMRPASYYQEIRPTQYANAQTEKAQNSEG
jgi:NADH-quinone oxidoreductase subunit I